MIKTNKQILITFDYELFLGARSGSVHECLLNPTNTLQILLTKYKAKAVFFIDILCLKYIKNQKELTAEYEDVIKQIKALYNEGHYIFPHLHPHWLDAKYLSDTKEFSLADLSRYSVAKLDVAQINSLFKEAISFLNEVGISYTKWGYRAGGWCIQPFSLFKNAFISESIRYEFSVLPGYKNENPVQHFDFFSFNKNQPYFFSENILEADQVGSFVQFPISTIEMNEMNMLKDRIVRKYLWKTNDKGFGNGTSAQTGALKSISPKKEMISIDALTIAKLSTYKKYLLKNEYMHWISHPKMFTRHGLRVFESFLNYASNQFSVEYDFEKMIPKK